MVQGNLSGNAATDAALRFRLWSRLTKPINLPCVAPLSMKSSTRAASAYAVQISEKLAPLLPARRRKARRNESEAGLTARVGGRAADNWKMAKTIAVAMSLCRFHKLSQKKYWRSSQMTRLSRLLRKQPFPKFVAALCRRRSRPGIVACASRTTIADTKSERRPPSATAPDW